MIVMEFRDRRGDWGRDLVFWAGREYGGYTLRELGEWAGGVDYSAVSGAIARLTVAEKIRWDLRSAMKHVRRKCEA